MRRRALIAVLLTAVLSGCVGASPRSPDPSDSAPSSTGVSPSAVVSPHRLARVVLTADLSSRFSGWDRVASIPFGDATDELGFRKEGRHGSLNIIPESFAVGADGSLWVLDGYKERVAHYSSSGTYLGSMGHFPWETRWETHDLVWQDGRLYVLVVHSWTVAGRVVVLNGHGQDPAVPITLNGDPADVYLLVPGAAQLTGEIHGYAELAGHTLGSLPPGWGALDVPGTGAVQELPGVPLPDGASMSVGGVGFPVKPDQVEVSLQSEGAAAVLPLWYRVATEPGAEPLNVNGSGTTVSGVTDHGIVCYVMISSALPGGKPAGGRWLLGLSEDGTGLLWERLPDPGVSDELQWRNLTVGPDGGIYLMVPDEGGVTIYRRPG